MPDAIASRVIREEIVPRIRVDDRDGAIQAGVEALVAAVEGRASPVQPGGEGTTAERDRPLRGTRPLSTAQKVLVGLVALAFLILFITNPSLAIYLLFSALSSGRGGFGGSGGGGGYSGGGGRSGGGGATGSW